MAPSEFPACGLRAAADSLLRELVAFEPGTFAGDDCAGVVELLARVDKACAAARLRAAARAAACGAPVARGFVRASDWLAQHTGTSISEAQRTLQIAAKLEALPATRDAVVAGELSVDQAHEIVATVEACPDAERAMLAAARAGNLWSLRDEGRRRRLSAVDVETLHRRQHAARFHQHWRDGDGMIRDTGALAPEAGIAVMNRLDGETDRAWRAAQRSGRHESRERYAADAFARVVTGGGSGRPGRADVVFVHDVGTGTSTVIGGGPVPAPTVRVALEDAFVKAVLHDGTKVDTVAHYGRHFPAILRTALEIGDPPAFEGQACVDCGRQLGLEWDHLDPVANGGLTALGNLRPRCTLCHHAKTERDRAAGLLARPRAKAPP